jgi:hypothetical protein
MVYKLGETSGSENKMADLARDWWRLLLTPAGGLPGPIIPTLILIQQSPENVENLKADLPAHIRKDLHEFYNSPPAPAYASIVHGRFAMGGESVGRLFSFPKAASCAL